MRVCTREIIDTHGLSEPCARVLLLGLRLSHGRCALVPRSGAPSCLERPTLGARGVGPKSSPLSGLVCRSGLAVGAGRRPRRRHGPWRAPWCRVPGAGRTLENESGRRPDAPGSAPIFFSLHRSCNANVPYTHTMLSHVPSATHSAHVRVRRAAGFQSRTSTLNIHTT